MFLSFYFGNKSQEKEKRHGQSEFFWLPVTFFFVHIEIMMGLKAYHLTIGSMQICTANQRADENLTSLRHRGRIRGIGVLCNEAEIRGC